MSLPGFAQLDIRAAIICWTPTREGVPGRVVVERLGDAKNKLAYQMSAGAVDRHWRRADDQTRLLMMMTTFHTIVVRDGIDPISAHKAFSQIAAYRALLSRFGDEESD
jgi:hypothetical protein